MSNNLENLSIQELQALVNQAQTALTQKQQAARKDVIAQIKELAASIGVTVEIIDNAPAKKRGGGSVEAKYRNPNNPSETWTGRGLAPKWMQALKAEGRDKEEFRI
jgi:DNA-binding protein H-NS